MGNNKSFFVGENCNLVERDLKTMGDAHCRAFHNGGRKS